MQIIVRILRCDFSVYPTFVGDYCVAKMKLITCVLVFTAAVLADTNVEQLLKEGNDQFTAKLFQEAIKINPGKSVVQSAFSVLTPLSQLAVASVGESHDEILNAIGMPNDNVTKEAVARINTRLSSVKGVELKQASKVYISSGYTLNDEFAELSKNVFHSEVENVDFSNPIETAKKINEWVEEQTNKRIKELVDPSTIGPDTVTVLANAIYFKGRWMYPFSQRATYERDFYVTKENKVKMSMMHKRHKFKNGYSSELGAKFLELPYVGDETSFVVVLPDEVDGVDALIKKLEDPAAFTRGLQTMTSQTVIVDLPKFKIETTINLKQAFENMNLTKLFSSGTARLDNLIKGGSNLYVSDAIQKAFIEVNEVGAEGAAANALNIVLKKKQIIQNFFTADHPFLFFLMQKDIILFNGVFRS
ncbi:antichymotrypsin-2-like isoform X2 [Anticarsia gemmatalis]|uniref:antichymotrypsin-2-like isoform X2 n=1 Tax=Anticarsia gemmatalis TaxID=129554 RepID=UPI003F7735EE